MLFGPLAPAPLFFGCARTNQLLGEGLDRSDGTIQTRVDRLAGDEPLRPGIIVCEEPRFVSRDGFDQGSRFRAIRDEIDSEGESSNDGQARALHVLEQLPVTIVAEIGSLTVTLGELKAIRPGMLIKLGTRGPEEVTLRSVDGPPLAYAELVDIGGHLGMQIVRLAVA